MRAGTLDGATSTPSFVTVPHARDASGYRTQRQWGTIWSLARKGGVVGPGGDEARARLLAYYVSVTAEEPLRSLTRGARSVRVLSVYRSVLPQDRDAPPTSETLLADLRLGE
jgi:hypothetical protein